MITSLSEYGAIRRDLFEVGVTGVAAVLEKWEATILDDWLKTAELDKSFTHPVLTDPVDVALDEQMAASAWSKLFPKSRRGADGCTPPMHFIRK